MDSPVSQEQYIEASTFESWSNCVGDEIHFLLSFHQLAENLLCLAVKESIAKVSE
jgi:hypothetical protein